MLDAVVDYLPSPLDIPPTMGTVPRKEGVEVERPADDSAPFSALAFKIMTDPYVGKLTYLRVYSGTLTKGSGVVNSTKDRKERVGRILQMHANSREDLDAMFAGDIVAAVGLKQTTTGDTLCDPDDQVILESLTFPEPVIHVAVEAPNQGRPGQAVEGPVRSVRGDPTFRVQSDEGDRSDGHLGDGRAPPRGPGRPDAPRVQRGRQRREAQVAYRETVRKTAEKVEMKYVRQTGGKGQYGHVVITLEPRAPAAVTSSRTRSPAVSSRRSTSPRSTRASASRSPRACSPATRPWTSRSS